MATESAKSIDTPKKLPVFSTIFGAYGLIIDKFKNFVFLGMTFIPVLMAIYIFSGQTTICYNNIYQGTFFCSNNIVLFILSRLVGILLMCMFIRVWAQNALAEEKQNWKQFFIPRLADLKIAGGFLVYILSLLIAGYSFYLLLVREPSPNWRIEWTYFTVVSLGFFMPILALRFSLYFAFLALEQKCPPLNEVWKKTSGSTFSLLGGIFILLFISLFLSQALVGRFMQVDSQSLFRMLGSEFLSDIILLFVAACFMNYCYLQKIYLFGKDENEKSVNA